MKLPRSASRSLISHDPVSTTQNVAVVGQANGSSTKQQVRSNLSRDEMDQALATGSAQHLSPLITDFVHHQNHWWVAYPDGWLSVEDNELIRLLNSQQRRFAGGENLGLRDAVAGPVTSESPVPPIGDPDNRKLSRSMSRTESANVR